MKNIPTFNDFLNENLRLGKTDKLLNKMTVTDFEGKRWEMNVVEIDNELDPNSPDAGKEMIIVITGEFDKTPIDSSVWIPKEQWDEFKKMINNISI